MWAQHRIVESFLRCAGNNDCPARSRPPRIPAWPTAAPEPWQRAVSLAQETKAELEHRVLRLIIVLGVQIFNLGLGHIQLRLR